MEDINKVVESLAFNFDNTVCEGGSIPLATLVQYMARVCYNTTSLGLMAYREALKAIRQICKGYMIIAFMGYGLGLDQMRTVKPRRRTNAPILDIYLTEKNLDSKIEFRVMDMELTLRTGKYMTIGEYISEEMNDEILDIHSFTGFKIVEK